MAYKIDPDACVNCGVCESDCPSGAISEQDDKRVIDAGACVDCGSCEGSCPAGAIAQA